MRKKIITVTGNIASGKSTFCKRLAAALGYTHMAMDDYRIRYGDWTVQGDNEAKRRFKADFAMGSHIIYESIGRGSVFQHVMRHYAAFVVTRIRIETELETCLRRHYNREQTVPYPYGKGDIAAQLADIRAFLATQPYDYQIKSKEDETETIAAISRGIYKKGY